MLEGIEPSMSMHQQPPSFGRLTSPVGSADRLLCVLLVSRARAAAAPLWRQYGGGDGGAARGAGVPASTHPGNFCAPAARVGGT